MKRTFIIAEAGVNHNGSLEMGLRLIDAAKRAGADAVKFQTLRAAHMVSKFASKAEYQKRTTSRHESHYEMIKKLELDVPCHKKLIAHCKAHGIVFLSSAFDESGTDLLDRLNVPMFKIPSPEVINLPLLEHIAKKGRPMILSTGMCTLGEIEVALDCVFATGNRDITLLHCVTEYPAPYGEINLRAMLTMRQAFGLPVGYSDHSPGIEIAVAAVALGATVIEKHVTLDRSLPGPDHKASLEPHELRAMCESIRNVEKALGNGVKKPAPCEQKNIAIARKGVVARSSLRRGRRLRRADLDLKRPCDGVPPAQLHLLVGRKLGRNIGKDEVIRWEDID